MKSFLLLDINVWIALTCDGHVHHRKAREWFAGLEQSARLFFCRTSQLGFLRLLTNQRVMGADVKSQEEAWQAYDRWLEDDRISLLDEPAELEPVFRSLANSRHPAVMNWTDSYLAAFAVASRLTLVTFDRGLQGKIRDLVILEV
jgi:toxin-antitoxin system PIN domain toxin